MKAAHPYGLETRERVIQVFAICGVVFAFAFGLIVDKLGKVPWWLDTPAVLGFYSLLYLLLDRVAWRWGWVSRLIKVPSLGGEWSGVIRTSHDNVDKDHEISVTVRQTWSRILVCLEGNVSRSASTAAHIFEGASDGSYEIVYWYENTPRGDAGQTMHPHLGTAHLKLTITDGAEVLDGDYYTGRGRNTHGRIILRRRASAAASS